VINGQRLVKISVLVSTLTSNLCRQANDWPAPAAPSLKEATLAGFNLHRLLTNASKGHTAIYQRVLLAAFSKLSRRFAAVRYDDETRPYSSLPDPIGTYGLMVQPGQGSHSLSKNLWVA